MLFDFHVHTAHGSSDSELSIPTLVRVAGASGLDGVCLTEHRGPWNPFDFRRLQEQNPGLIFVNAMEVDSPGCHLTVFGLNRHIGGLQDPALLRRVADAEGASIVLAHPFRNFLSSPTNNLLFGTSVARDDIETLSRHPIFDVIDAIEVTNGGTSAVENELALQIARLLGMPTVGGSDAHSQHGIGRFVTVVEGEVRDGIDLLAHLKAGNVYAANRDETGAIVPSDFTIPRQEAGIP
jgi:predicted metal-dependent phosphoesterase TrpH